MYLNSAPMVNGLKIHVTRVGFNVEKEIEERSLILSCVENIWPKNEGLSRMNPYHVQSTFGSRPNTANPELDAFIDRLRRGVSPPG